MTELAMTEEMRALAAAIVQAQKNAGNVHKASANKFHRYDYASAEDVIKVARLALGEAGLAFTLMHYDVHPLEPHDMLEASYALVHEGGASRTITSSTPIIPEKGRPADKALAAAKTYDLSYALRAVLNLPRVDEQDDVDARDDRQHEPPARPMSVAGAKLAVKEHISRLGRPKAIAEAQRLFGDIPREDYTADQWRELATELGHMEVQS